MLMFFRKKSKPAKPAGASKPRSPAAARRVDTSGHRSPEQRREVRRDTAERRNDIRWKPGGADRRQSHGRRKTDSAWRHH
ncbi:MAG: hypothetical protein AAB294_06505 [Pseudomonadota bacterium]